MVRLSEISGRAETRKRPRNIDRECSICGGSGGQYQPAEPPCFCDGSGRIVYAPPGAGPKRPSKAANIMPIRPMGRDGLPVDDGAFAALRELGWCDMAPVDDPRHLVGSGWLK